MTSADKGQSGARDTGVQDLQTVRVNSAKAVAQDAQYAGGHTIRKAPHALVHKKRAL